MRWRELNLAETKGGFAYITTTTEDLNIMLYSENRVLIDRCHGMTNNKGTNEKLNISGIVLLAVILLNKCWEKNGTYWNEDHFKFLKSRKQI